MIKVQNISFNIGSKHILKDISFDVHQGELLAIIGPNGAGKSTLLKLLCKEIETRKGSILIQNHNIRELKHKTLAKYRSVLAQSNDVSINFNVGELVMMGRYPHFESNPTTVDTEVVQQVLSEMGITHLKERDYYTLSGGEKQRVQLARVLAQIYDQPNGILFLDEPINGLDIRYQQIILDKARQMADKNFTVICILHDMNFAARYADKVLILKDGSHIAYGDPNVILTEETIYDTYQTRVKIIHDDDLGYPLIAPISSSN